jgi:hypothetical protein
MAEPGTFSVEINLETMDMYRFSLTTLFRRFRWFLIAVVALLIVVSLNIIAGQWDWSWQNLLGPAFLVLIPYAFLVSPYFASRKYLRKNPNLTGPFTYIFSDQGIEISGPHSQGRLTWEAIIEVRETPTQFLLYPQTAIADIIPKRFLPNVDQQATLRALLRAHVKKVKLRG